MLQIDLKPSLNVGTGKELKRLKRTMSVSGGQRLRPQSAKMKDEQGHGLNSYTSLNRANRIRSLARIIDENKILLDKLQNTRSNYQASKWENDFQEK